MTGTVKIDSSDKLDNLYKLARRARDEENVEKASQHYEQILLEKPNDWEATFYSAYYSSLLSFKNVGVDRAIVLLEDCIDSVMVLIKDNLKNDTEQESIVIDVADKIDRLTMVYARHIKEKFVDFSNNLWNAPLNNRTKSIGRDHWRLVANQHIDLSQVYAKAAFKVLELFGENQRLDNLSSFLIAKAGNILNSANNTLTQEWMQSFRTYYNYEHLLSESEINQLIDSYDANMSAIREQYVKRRTEKYWNAHQAKKVELESEKKSLAEKIAALNSLISAIPKKTKEYAEMAQLQEKIQKLTSEKDAPGFLSFKEKSTVQAQIDSANKEIVLLQSRIDSAVEEVKKRILPLEDRIKAIDTELTRPR